MPNAKRTGKERRETPEEEKIRAPGKREQETKQREEVAEMLWTWPTSRYGSMWSDMDRLHREMNRLFEPFSRNAGHANGNFPAVNIWTGEDSALLTAELPGIDPEKLEVTVKNDTVTIRGSREHEPLKKGESYVRQERGAGTFVRSFSLPFHVDSGKVSAQYQKGILQLTLPRREEDKPKKIAVTAA